MKEAQNILTELDPPVLYYGEIQWVTILRKDIAGFIPNPLYLNGYNFRGMYRTALRFSNSIDPNAEPLYCGSAFVRCTAEHRFV